MKVLAIIMGETRPLIGSEIYRITMPHSYLRKHGWNCQAIFWQDLVKKLFDLGLFNAKGWNDLIDFYDLFIFPRMFLPDAQSDFHEGLLNLLKEIQRHGKKVIYEVDDDYTNRHRPVIDGDALKVVRHSDAVTCTTTLLQDIMSEGKPTYILPNMVSPDALGGKPKGELLAPEIVVLGLSGSPTHATDWEVLKDVLPRLVQRPDVHLFLGGFHPDYLKDLPNTTYLAHTDYQTYCQMLKRCDIILAPVNPLDGFNLGKSPIKVLEGMAASRFLPEPAGAATIATNHPVYQLAIQHEVNGLLVDHTADAWEHSLRRLIDDAPYRKALQINGHRWVWKKHDISKHWSMWANAYKAIHRRS